MNVIIEAAQRKVTRRQVQVPCQVVRERDFRLVAERTLDLSVEGMRVRSASDIALGEKMIVSFQAPCSQMWFDAEAEVVRTIRGKRGEDRGKKSLALRFCYFDRVSEAIVRAKLRGFPPPTPSRRHRQDYASSVRRIFESSYALA